MIVFRFDREDVLNTRFAVSPLFEITAAMRVLRDPGRHSLHLPWAEWGRRRLAGADLALLEALLTGPATYHPDFVAPPPASPLPAVEDELRRVEQTPPATVREEVLRRFVGRAIPAEAATLAGDPPRELPRLVGQLRTVWERALAPHWPAMHAVLEADILHRARRLTEAGPGEVFARLHPLVRWRDGELAVDRRHDQTVELGGRGLLLVPIVFAWPEVFAMTDPPWQPTLLYAPRGAGALWDPDEPPAAEALAELIGRRRAAILAALDEPATTSALAARLAITPSSVSEHLGVLRRAGLVSARRDGRRVLYARTATGEALVG